MLRWMLFGTVVLAGCPSSVVVSSVTSAGDVVPGKLFSGKTFPEDNAGVVARSAAHDLPCALARVKVTQNGTRWMGEGCGGRVVYDEKCLRMGEGDPADWTGREAKLPADTDVVCRVKLLGHVTM